MDRSQSLDDNLPILIGACPKQSIAHERARLQMERTRSNSRGRSIHTRRTRGSAAEIEDDSTPTRLRTDSIDFVDTPIGMGPATALTSPTRYSDIGTAGVRTNLRNILRKSSCVYNSLSNLTSRTHNKCQPLVLKCDLKIQI